MNSCKRTVLIGVILLALSASAAWCAAEGDVMLADYLLFRVRCPAAGQSIAQRADAIQSRANDLLVIGGIDLGSVRIEPVGTDVIIYAGGGVLATVGECDARANNTTPMGLAVVWANRFREIYPIVVPKPATGPAQTPQAPQTPSPTSP